MCPRRCLYPRLPARRPVSASCKTLRTSALKEDATPCRATNCRPPWLSAPKPPNGWRMLGDPAVHSSMPLANMISAVQDLIDPDFDPLTAILDEEPRFLKPLPTHISPEDLEFLRFRGALTIPESGLRNELLRSYIKWVHSFMPVLNLQRFLRSVAENDPNGNVSVLLFQAVMFVGTAFVDLKHLQDAGYSSRKSARDAFFTRLRLLYSLDCEEDRIVILQVSLLMTYWSDPQNCRHRDIWDWIGICNTQAHSIGLNVDPSTANVDPQTRRLRTRLWWCLYSRDRLIAMGMRRPLQVNEGTSNVPMLKREDFDFEPFSPSAVALFRCRQLEDRSHQKRLATMFIEKVKLCQCIGRVLFAQYTPSQRQLGATDRTTVTLIPRQASESEFTRCRQKLDSWLGGLPKEAQFIPASGNSQFRDGEDVLLLHGAMLRMLYHATSSALHRPWAANTTDQSKARVQWRDTARSRMHEAATGITHIIQGLHNINLTRFLPQSGVTVVLPAAVAHLSNSMSENPAIRESSLYNFHRCIHVLHCLKDMYPAANIEFANLEAAIKHQSGNYNSNTFFQIMQHNFDTPTISLGDLQHNNNVDTVSTPNSLDRPTPENPSRNRAASSSGAQAQKIEPTPTHNSNASQPNTYQTPFPNDFDFNDNFATPETTADHPFPFLATDFDAFPDTAPPDPPTSLPIQSHELDDLDWVQALFPSTPNAERATDDLFDHTAGLEFLNTHETDLDSDPSPFDYSLPAADTGNKRHYSTSHTEITGDLDRDLGLNDGNDMF
ncbi:hypothetical protein N7468_006275 [Penicillium chermesinum]|uniref:Xylanolytic transcriptional activator regulatory domain-containing protein n=1 Tax=Penicillium chermesinum TaxID=63820 RepID=A0A9W9TKZ5_9EURO|nr:uncharacterized protein N7468_006275 [Penicillium chermesinum]KAJ5225050.1 hypothetical protein N7468_006275 [Penicillium chermesinum]KAJ6151781.1 hypothetical protein N7470_006909 [Penicillium chermesinum]